MGKEKEKLEAVNPVARVISFARSVLFDWDFFWLLAAGILAAEAVLVVAVVLVVALAHRWCSCCTSCPSIDISRSTMHCGCGTKVCTHPVATNALVRMAVLVARSPS